jgi:hypothetical protein
MTVTPPGGANRPISGPPLTSIGTVTVSGANTASDGDTETYTVAISGDASNLSYSWTVTGDGIVNESATNASVSVDLSTGTAAIQCEVTSGDAGVTDSPATGSTSVTVT